MVAKNKGRITLQKLLWCKIRYYQMLHEITDDTLAATLEVNKRTLTTYDKDSGNITLAKVDKFLFVNRITLEELLK
ncbi:MAG TPA: hypothetical protein DCW90_23560 [Lachnospiraceae bacterium]|nr:hypothetical protein [Lachnospiraceae bacterium]